jgi:hypothetical protein
LIVVDPPYPTGLSAEVPHRRRPASSCSNPTSARRAARVYAPVPVALMLRGWRSLTRHVSHFPRLDSARRSGHRLQWCCAAREARDGDPYGDTRFTDPSNVTATNPRARGALIARIADERPDAVVISGDVPCMAASRMTTRSSNVFHQGDPQYMIQREYYKPSVAVGLRWSGGR